MWSQTLEIQSLAEDESNATILGDSRELTQETCPVRNVDSARYETSQAWAISFFLQCSEHALHGQHSSWEREIPSGATVYYPDYPVTSQRFKDISVIF